MPESNYNKYIEELEDSHTQKYIDNIIRNINNDALKKLFLY